MTTTPTQAIHPLDREGCWLCAGGGEIETYRASDDHQVTVGCPVCVQNDLSFMRQAAETARDDLAGELMLVRADRDALAAVLAESADLLDALDKHTHPAIELDTLSATLRKPSTKALQVRDDRMKAKALADFVASYEVEHDIESHVMGHLQDAAGAYREQAEGES